MSESRSVVHGNKDCLFCKIINKEVETYELIETKYSIAFLDTHPKNRLHVLIVPKYHGKFLQNIPDQYLTDILPVAKRFAIILTKMNKDKQDTENIQNEEEFPFKILQNNGVQAGQEVDHVHFHFIPVGPVKLGPHAESTDKQVFVQELKEFQQYLKEELSK